MRSFPALLVSLCSLVVLSCTDPSDLGDADTDVRSEDQGDDSAPHVEDDSNSGGSFGSDDPVASSGGQDGEEGSGGKSGAGSGGTPPTNCEAESLSNEPLGYGEQTTGGGNATPIVVSSFAAAAAALEAYQTDFEAGKRSSLVLHYNGSFDFSTITDVCAQHEKEPQLLQVKEMENVTILGTSGSSGNFGVRINRAKNVIVRNMTLGLLPGADYSDAIMIEGNGTNGDVENVWVDHNDLFSSTKDDCPGAGDTEFDGLVDVKSGARYITISYNFLHDHQKTSLVGFSDKDTTDRYITYHHNWFENVVSRTPLIRSGYVHLFNNYFNEVSSTGINVRAGAVVLIEKNFFEHVHNPVTSRYSDTAGYWDLRDNWVGPGITWSVSSDTLANADDWQSTADFPAAKLTYDYRTTVAGCVKQIVMETAGAIL